MSKVTTEDCKMAIVEWVFTHPGFVTSQFVDVTDPNFEKPALDIKNWKRMTKQKDGPAVVREFDCKPYDDQLRATVIEQNGHITSVYVEGQ